MGITCHLKLSAFFLLKIYFIDYAITIAPLLPVLLSLQQSPPQFMSMGHTYKFFGFSISFNILYLPCLFCTYHLCLFPVPFSPFSPSLLITLHVISISVNLFLFQLFAQFVFVFVFLGPVVDNCEFVVILLFIVLIFFFFLDKSL